MMTNTEKWNKYEDIKKIINKFVFIHTIMNWEKDDFVHDLSIKIISKLHLFDPHKSSNVNKKDWWEISEEWKFANWCLSNIKYWQREMAKKYKKEINFQENNLDFDDYYDFLSWENEQIEVINETHENDKLKISFETLIYNKKYFNKYDRYIYELLYKLWFEIDEIADKIWITEKEVIKYKKDFIKKLKIFQDFL